MNVCVCVCEREKMCVNVCVCVCVCVMYVAVLSRKIKAIPILYPFFCYKLKCKIFIKKKDLKELDLIWNIPNYLNYFVLALKEN